MKRVGLALIALLLLALPAAAQDAVAKWRSCHTACEAVAGQCEFINDLDSCETDKRACKLACDDENPPVAVCMEQCEGLMQFCTSARVNSRKACTMENRMCEQRCNAPIYSRLP